MEKREETPFRGLAARGNYLSTDRPDIQYAAKEVCREMARPTRRGQKRLKRLARYLAKVPRVFWKFGWQRRQNHIKVYTDSDWAGCRKTRRSTSGGIIMIGDHLIKCWSRTQKTVTLSSGEAELLSLIHIS